MNAIKHFGVIGKKATHLAQRVVPALVVVAGLALVSAPMSVQAQATSGSIVGEAPAGDTIVVKSSAGDQRKAKVKKNGRYAIRALPLGVYTVLLMKDGEEYDTHYNVRLRPGGSARVDFPCKNDHCAKS